MALFSFGVIADIQYADKDNGSWEGRTLRYREAPAKLQQAVAFFRQRAAQQPALSCLLTLGDMVDGYKGDPDKSTADLKAMLAILEGVGSLPQHHVLGNHCLSVPRQQLLDRLQLQSSYYTVPLAPGWRLVVLDTTDMSLHSGHDEASPQMVQARQWQATHPLSEHPNAHPWNGGISTQQLQWLRQQLADATAAGTRLIVACHHPLLKGSAPDMYRAWDADMLASELCDCPAVALVLNGHHHPGGAATADGLHFITLEGLLEAPPDSNAFAVVEVHGERIVIQGHGYATSRELPLRAVPAAATDS